MITRRKFLQWLGVAPAVPLAAAVPGLVPEPVDIVQRVFWSGDMVISNRHVHGSLSHLSAFDEIVTNTLRKHADRLAENVRHDRPAR